MSKEFEPKKHLDSDGNEETCSSCGANVPTIKHSDYDGEDKYTCVFCFESYGRGNSSVDKGLMANMFNILLRELKNP